jgi:hypothetical protein
MSELAARRAATETGVHEVLAGAPREKINEEALEPKKRNFYDGRVPFEESSTCSGSISRT